MIKMKTYAYRLTLTMFTLLSKTCTFKYYFPSYSHASSSKQSLIVHTLKESKPKLSSTDNLWREKKNAYNQEKYPPHWQQSLSETKHSKKGVCTSTIINYSISVQVPCIKPASSYAKWGKVGRGRPILDGQIQIDYYSSVRHLLMEQHSWISQQPHPQLLVDLRVLRT